MIQFPLPRGNSRDKSSPSGPGGGGIVWSGPVPVVGGEENKNYLLFDFGLWFFKVRVISHAVYMIAAGMDYVFVRKNEVIFRRVVGEELIPKIIVCI